MTFPERGASGLLRSDTTEHPRTVAAPTTMPVMAGAEELEPRVAALETHVQELADRVQRSEQDGAAARLLAGGADRDVTEIRGEIRDFREHNSRVLGAMRSDLTDMTQRMESGFAEVRGALDATSAGQAQIVELLNEVIRRGS